MNDTAAARGKIKCVAPVFMPCNDTDGSTLKLGDLKAVKGTSTATDVKPTNFTLQFVDTQGEIAIFDDEEAYPPVATAEEDILATFGYVSESYATSQKIANGAGWYLLDDTTYSYNLKDYVIGLGLGFEIVSSAKGSAYLTYNGAVCKTSLRQGGNRGDIICTGNVAPTDKILGDFVAEKGTSTATAVKPTNNTLQFVDVNGEIDVFTDEEFYPPCAEAEEDILATFGYVTPEYATSQSIANGPGWYLLDDLTYSYNMNNYPIEAGKGFEFVSSAKGSAKIVLPPAVAAEE